MNMVTQVSRWCVWSRLVVKAASIAAMIAVMSFVYIHTAYTVAPFEMVAEVQGQTACSDAQMFSTVLVSGLPSGDIYVYLANKDEKPGKVTLYYQPLTSTQCTKLGTAVATNVGWTRVAPFSASGQGGYLSIAGSGLTAGPYQAVANVLVVQDRVCQPTTQCNVTYEGHTGILQPDQISGATDQISVFVAEPIAGVNHTSVQYYSDASYLYGSNVIAPINTNYLGGGSHQIQTLIQLTNGETIEIDRRVNMGTDYSGLLWLRSTFYRTSGAARVIFIALVVIGLILASLVVARIIIGVRRWRREHGLAGYKFTFTKTKSKVISG